MIHLDARLRTALEISPVCHTAADIACDHGKLGAALLLENRAQFLIDTDISEMSIKKAQNLTRSLFLSERTTFRVGNGLSVLDEGEAQNIYLLGIGGTLMREILSASDKPLRGAEMAVLQPMKSQEDVRFWLFQKGYHVQQDRMILDGGHYYQIFSVLPPDGNIETKPEWWPDGCWSIGYRAAESGDPVLHRYLNIRIRELGSLIQKGAPLENELRTYQRILEMMEQTECN